MRNIELTPEEQNALQKFISQDNTSYLDDEYTPAGWKQIPFSDLQAWVDSQISPVIIQLIKKGVLSRHLDFKTSRYGEKSLKVRITIHPSAMVQITENGVVAGVLP